MKRYDASAKEKKQRQHVLQEQDELEVLSSPTAQPALLNTFTPTTVLQLQSVIGNAAVQRLMKPISPLSTPQLQRQLDDTTRRLRRTGQRELIESDWKKVLEANNFSKDDIRRIATEANSDALKQQFEAMYAIDIELDDNFSHLKGAAKQKRKNHIKDRLEAAYALMLTYAENQLDEVNEIYQQGITQAVQAIGAYYNGGQRVNAQGKPITTKALLKYEKETVLPPLLAQYRHARVRWLDDASFTKAALEQYHAGHQPQAPVLSQPNQQQLAKEKTDVVAQVQAWATVNDNDPGTNENGTWGTSAKGAGASFAISKVNATVWPLLRKWWIKQTGCFVTPSDTSTYSLKKDRDTTGTTLSPRFNYHINVG